MSSNKSQDSLPIKYVLSALSASVAETVTFPIDITKTRLQLQGEREAMKKSGVEGLKVAPSQRAGMFRTAFGIVQDEGFLNLYRGLAPAVMRHMVYSGFRLTFYEIIRDKIFKKGKDGRYPLWKGMATGMISGGLGQFLANPMDLVKVRLQMEGKRMLEGHQPRYRGMWNAYISIWNEEGLRGLWKGWQPAVQRSALVCLGDLATYDYVKQMLLRNTDLKDNALTHSISSICSGFISASLGTPADVLKTRMYNQPYLNGEGVHYRSTLDCLVKTVKGEGLLALYKGFIPVWSRMAPWSLTFWIVYEEIRVLAGLGNF